MLLFCNICSSKSSFFKSADWFNLTIEYNIWSVSKKLHLKSSTIQTIPMIKNPECFSSLTILESKYIWNQNKVRFALQVLRNGTLCFLDILDFFFCPRFLWESTNTSRGINNIPIHVCFLCLYRKSFQTHEWAANIAWEKCSFKSKQFVGKPFKPSVISRRWAIVPLLVMTFRFKVRLIWK